MKKLFPKPQSVPVRDYNIYYILSLICVFACVLSIVLSTLLFYSASLALAILAILPASSALLINYHNRRGQHFKAVIFLFLLSYIFSLCATLYFGWHAGFQYYLIAEAVIFVLYPYLDLKYLFSLGLVAILTFLVLYLSLESIPPGDFVLNFILHTVNAVIAIALMYAASLFFRANAQYLIAKFNARASIDPLTGLLNRASMLKTMRQHCAAVETENQPSALILLNADRFKNINKTLGPAQADDILLQLARVIGQGTKATDHVARWGSDEFLLLSPYTFPKSALGLAESLRKTIGQHSFTSNGKAVTLTVSAGVAIIRYSNTLEVALSQVDSLMSEAKLKGRNQVCALPLQTSSR